MANWAAGRRGVGPGVKRRVFRIIWDSPRSGPGNQPVQRQSQNTHFCGFCELSVSARMWKSTTYLKNGGVAGAVRICGPTSEMLEAAWAYAVDEDAEGVWRSMIKASDQLRTGNSDSGS
jgi:hypothetical protein